ncbi:MAG: sigma-70 family RNA polymerase sigma factor [Solirubrobacteraceae bacterium]
MLVAAVRAGDDGAFEQLYERYQRRIAAYVYGMVHDHGRAEDVTQEVFISALRRLRATDAQIIFKPWIYEIAKNACIDAFRRSRRAEEVSYDADENGLDRSRLVSKSPTPDAAVDQRLTLQNLQGAFGGLSDAHHQILVMRELEGLSYRQIGERLGMSRPSVESTLFRARRRLSEEYDELVSGERCRRVQSIIAESAGGRLGVRDGRKMARHVSHCQPCRRAAGLAGVDLEQLAPRPARARLAALLPLPAFLRRRLGGGPDTAAAATPPGATFAQWTGAAAAYSDPVMSGWARAAAVAAGVAVAGLGAGAAGHHSHLGLTGRHAPAPTAAHVAPAAASAPRTGRPAVRSAGRQAPSSTRRTVRSAPARHAAGSSAPEKRAPTAAVPAATLPAAKAPATSDVGAPHTTASLSTGGSSPTTSVSTSVPAVKTPSVQVPTSVPSVGAPSASATVTAPVPAPVADATQTATGTASGAAGTVGGVTDDAGNLLGGG